MTWRRPSPKTRARDAQDVLVQAAKGAIILAVLERLLMTKPSNWLEVRRAARLARRRQIVRLTHAWTFACVSSDACPLTDARCASSQQEHIDYLGIQALLFKHTSMGFFAQLRVFFAHTKRIAD